MRHQYYKLVDHKPVPCPMEEWARFFENFNNRIVRRTLVVPTFFQKRIGETLVSTVFLGLDHNFSQSGPPILFETMVLDKEIQEEFMSRTCTWEDAEAAHEIATKWAWKQMRKKIFRAIIGLFRRKK